MFMVIKNSLNFSLDGPLTFFRLSKLNKERSNWTTLMVAVCFSVMTLLGAPLHQHDLGHGEVSPDCAPFHVFESSINLETNISDLSPLTQVTYRISLPESVSCVTESILTFSRAPPAFC